MNRTYQREVETSCEYSLPDYMGDVKKILTVSATALPSGKFAGESEVEFSGVVSYDILYSDSDGKLTHISTSSDYDIAVEVNGDAYIDSDIDLKVANLTVRLTGPRKLIAKATVAANLRISEENELKSVGNIFDGTEEPETETKKIRIEKRLYTSSEEREYAEAAERVDGVMPDEIEIIASSGAVRITESLPTENGVTVKGELIITVIIKTEEQPPFVIRKTVPFEEKVSLEGVNEGMNVMSGGYLTSVTAGVAEEGDGSVITVNAIAELHCEACENSEECVITDAYLKNRDTAAEYEDYIYSELICMGSAEENVSASVPRSECGAEAARDILLLNSDARSVKKEIVGNNIKISGEMAYTGVACEICDDNSVSYLPIKFTSPFDINLSCDKKLDSTYSVECTVSPIDTSVSLDAESVSAKTLVKAAYRVTKSSCVRRLVECNSIGNEEYRPTLSQITVCYPEADETLFDIAKKYHTTRARIAEDNALSESVIASIDEPVSLLGVKKLIIR